MLKGRDTTMKRLAIVAALVLLFGCILTGCSAGKSSMVGTWYSDRDDQSTLTLNKDGTYSDGTWLTSGKYTSDGSKLTLTSTLDGSITLLIQTENGKTVLYYDNKPYSHTYYGSAEAAQDAREARQADEQTADKEQAEKEQKALQGALVGYWYNTASYPIEFTTDGSFISYPLGKQRTGKYEILASDRISITGQDGVAQMLPIKLTENHLTFNGGNYTKSTPVDLSLDLLVGEWTDDTLTTVFTADGTYIEKSAFVGFVSDTTVTFSITGSNTIDVPDHGGSQWAFLSETDNEYQLILSKTKNGTSYTTYMTKAK